MLVFGRTMPEDCAAKAVSCEDAFISDEDEMDALDRLSPLFALVECRPIRPKVKEAAMANVMNVSVINGFFVLACFIRVNSPS
jgi:hypothetical protein